jgi:lysozyme family protein
VTDFERALAIVLRSEGGFVNDPADAGGATNFGITQGTYDAFRTGEKLPTRPVRKITKGEVGTIYLRRYWLAGKCDRLPWPLSLAHFDACVNAGIGQATKLLQRAVKVTADGEWGPVTDAAIRTATPARLFGDMLLERLRFYDRLVDVKPSQGKFFRGWVKRVLRLREDAVA